MDGLVVYGQEEMQKYLSLFAEAVRRGLRFNLLIEGAPGTAKTLAVNRMLDDLQKELGKSVPYTRVTGSQDALPSDLIGDLDIRLYKEGDVDIIEGPLFCAHGDEYPGVIYADEINRFNEFTLIIFTEIMAEWQVSFPKTPITKPLRANVIATMNPYDTAGVTEIPQHILDRFNARILVNYPPKSQELQISEQHVRVYYPEFLERLQSYFEVLVTTTRALRKINVPLGPRAYLSVLDLLALELSLGNGLTEEIVVQHYENSIRSRIDNLDENRQTEVISSANVALKGGLEDDG